MTTSPTRPPPQTLGQPLLHDRATSIGWYFIESYYDFYNSHIDAIYKLYHPNAALSHAQFPMVPSAGSTRDRAKLYRATGVEAIRARFANDDGLQKKDNRIVVTSADIQICLANKILIVVTGEWSKGGSPFYAFLQTFLLSPGRKENILDLANDILRFPGVQVYTREPQPDPKEVETETTAKAEVELEEAKKAEESEQEQPAESAAAAAATTTAPAAAAATAPAGATTTAPAGATTTAPAGATATAPAAATSTAPAAATATTPAAAAPEAKDVPPEGAEGEVADAAADIARTSGPKLLWAANLAATTAKKPTARSGLVVLVDESKDTHESSAAATSTSSPVATAAVAAKPSTYGPKYKKDEWFPIYIRGIRDPITEELLRKHLSAKFGPIKFLKVNIFIALCDFVDYELQQRALDAKETTLSGITIQLEVRESKANNGYTKVGAKGPKGPFKEKLLDKRLKERKQTKKVVAKP